MHVFRLEVIVSDRLFTLRDAMNVLELIGVRGVRDVRVVTGTGTTGTTQLELIGEEKAVRAAVAAIALAYDVDFTGPGRIA